MARGAVDGVAAVVAVARALSVRHGLQSRG